MQDLMRAGFQPEQAKAFEMMNATDGAAGVWQGWGDIEVYVYPNPGAITDGARRIASTAFSYPAWREHKNLVLMCDTEDLCQRVVTALR